jgi:hypothetical protein
VEVSEANVLRLPHAHYQSAQEREHLRSVLFALAKWPYTDMTGVLDPGHPGFVSQFTARVLAVSQSKSLAFRVVTLVYKRLHLQDYTVSQPVFPLPRDFGIEHARLGPEGLVSFGSRHTALRADALDIWSELQMQWPELADIFAIHHADEVFLQTTEFWLKTLLLQGHEPTQEERVSPDWRDRGAGESIELLHRVVMAALRGKQDADENEDADDGVHPTTRGRLPPGPVVQSAGQSVQNDGSVVDVVKHDPRFELRYLVLCVWVRNFRTLFKWSKTRESLVHRVRWLQYNFAGDEGLMTLIDRRYHENPFGKVPNFSSGFAGFHQAAWFYTAGAATGAILSAPSLGLVGLFTGVVCGLGHCLSGGPILETMSNEAQRLQVISDVEVVRKRRRERKRLEQAQLEFIQ